MIRLKNNDLVYLLSTFDVSKGMKTELEQAIKDCSEISDDTATALREMCSDRLTLIGFTKDDEPNEEGKYLESMIDKLYTE